MNRKILTASFLLTGCTWALTAAAQDPSEAGGSGRDSPEITPLGNQRELFLDDHLIDRLDGATLKLHDPRPANTILKIEKPWEGHHNFAIGAFHDKGRYYLYYRSMPGDRFGEHYGAVAVSDDGIHWTRPKVGLVELNGSTENNLVALEEEGGGLVPARAGLDFWLDTRPGVPESERFKLVTYLTEGGPHDPGPNAPAKAGISEHTAIFWASGDGMRFRKMNPAPVLSSRLKNSFDAFNAYFWSETEQQYLCYYRWYDKVRTITRITSRDLMTWSAPVPMTYGDTNREHLYTNQTTPYFRAPHLYVALATRFLEGRRVLTDEQVQQLKVSERYKTLNAGQINSSPADGVIMTTRAGSTEYDRTFMESFVRPGIGQENWVGRGNYPVRGIFQTGPAEMSFYVNRHYQQASWHIERLTLRLDGFASLHAPHEGGEMVTKPLTFTGPQMTINYSTSVAGDVRVEIQDAGGKPIPGFTLKEADYLIGDEVSRVVTWGGKSDVKSLAGKPVRLRFLLKDADVFAFRFSTTQD